MWTFSPFLNTYLSQIIISRSNQGEQYWKQQYTTTANMFTFQQDRSSRGVFRRLLAHIQFFWPEQFG
jgi:hypothetical protein